MTYDATETADLGRPVELYEFNFAGVVYRRTSAATDQAIGGNTYSVLAGLSRSEPVQGNEASAGEISIVCPADFAVASAFRGTIPSHLPSLTIFRKHLNDVDDEAVTYWKGTIVSASMSADGRKATLLGQPPTALFSRVMPRRVFSALCQHQLYDGLCGVDRQLYRFTGVLTALDLAGTTLTLTGLRAGATSIDTAQSLGLSASELDNFWNRGYIQTVASPGEFRSIIQTNVGGDPNVIKIAIPFRTASAGDDVDVFAGCNHEISTHCNPKFKNAARFGGFPYVPTVNPFEVELDSGRTNNPGTTTSRFARR